MAGVYIHIPFCKQACTYCNFHFSTLLKNADELLNAIEKEIDLTVPFQKDEIISTIYFGGGTPSIVGVKKINRLIEKLRRKFNISGNTEVTLEANPDDVSSASLSDWWNIGINRLSVGIQSFDESELKWMNRAHHAAESIKSLQLISQSHFTNYSVDLIFGSNYQSDQQLDFNLDRVYDFHVPHISCYSLTVEPKTKLHHLIHVGKEKKLSDSRITRQFLNVMDRMRKQGYAHYEVSNYALPGMKSRHNSSYWKGIPYYGFGPSAHSYDGSNNRKWNVANNTIYIKSIKEGIIPCESETLTPAQKLNEYIMTGFRLSEGIDLQHIAENWGTDQESRVEEGCRIYIQAGKIIKRNKRLCLTDEGILLADGIASDLFLT